ncbi:MAG: DUF2000 domain-containing protein [Thermoanaerobaculia bacterium]
MEYDYKRKKIVAVLASNLDVGVALNVVGHMAVSLGAHCPDRDLMGRNPLVDATGNSHVGIAKYPFIITKVKQGKLRRVLESARKTPGIFIIDYPSQMLSTGHDDELGEAIAGTREEQINYLGILLYGDRPQLEELTGRFTLWRSESGVTEDAE